MKIYKINKTTFSEDFSTEPKFVGKREDKFKKKNAFLKIRTIFIIRQKIY